MRVRVYRNLNKGGLSIQTKADNGKWYVTDYALHAVLADCTYKVQQGGRKAVLEKHQKNVHAWIEGELISTTAHGYNKSSAPIPRYNPYHTAQFEIAGKPVTASNTARVYCPAK